MQTAGRISAADVRAAAARAAAAATDVYVQAVLAELKAQADGGNASPQVRRDAGSAALKAALERESLRVHFAVGDDHADDWYISLA
jgi:hypothetical protein